MKNRYLIVGVDPGVKTGLCAIDLNCNMIDFHSAKKLGLNDIINWTLKRGRVIIFACDVKKPSSILIELCRKMDAKLISPNKDIKSDEKQNIVDEFFNDLNFEDSHQKDACASAIYAFKKYESLFKRIDKKLSSIDKKYLSDEVKQKIVLGKCKNINDAITNKSEEIDFEKNKRERHIEKESKETLLEKDLIKTKNHLHELKDKYKRLKKENNNLKRLIKLKKSNSELLELTEKRNSTIRTFRKKINSLKNKLIFKNKEIHNFVKKSNFLQSKPVHFLKKLDDLSKKSVEELNEKNFKNVLHIKSLSIPSEESLKKIKDLRIKIILVDLINKEISEKLKKFGFDIFQKKDLTIKKYRGFEYIEKREIDKLKRSPFSIENLIYNYKKRKL